MRRNRRLEQAPGLIDTDLANDVGDIRSGIVARAVAKVGRARQTDADTGAARLLMPAW